ncbi:MAG: DNA polymerase III subunit beta [bacterium ADurb.Bin400]|nr:MAG: DNA polymerase III subunit beta [bacterium ADurb.Bin400]
MKATILQSNFAKGLNQVSRVVASRTTLPVLGNILIVAKKGKITFSATDLEVGITTHVAGKVEEDGEITIPARLLLDFISNNTDETIELVLVDTKIHLKSEHYEANISGISAEEFPTIPNPPEDVFCSLKRSDFVDAIKKVAIAPANDETRPVLAGIYFHFNGKVLTMAATDSYRLAEKKVNLESSIPEKKLIVPSRTMTEVLRLLSALENIEEIALSSTENQVFFQIGETHLVSRVIEGAFPNYSQIIPSGYKVLAKEDYREFLAALKMTSLFAKDAANNIKIKTTDQNLIISSAHAQSGDATSKVSAEVSGNDMEIAFNARYLLDALQAVSSKAVTLKLNDSSSAAVLEFDQDKNYLYIIMPLKIEG